MNCQQRTVPGLENKAASDLISDPQSTYCPLDTGTTSRTQEYAF
jgi:hypothetical protein